MATKTTKAVTARQLRQRAAEMLEDLLDMTRTLVRVGEASDWLDERLSVWELQLRHLEDQRAALLAEARAMESGKRGRAA